MLSASLTNLRFLFKYKKDWRYVEIVKISFSGTPAKKKVSEPLC